MESPIGLLSITNDDLQRILEGIIDQDGVHNDIGIKLLLTSMLKENPNACQWLTAFMLGRDIPYMPEVGAVGYIKLETIQYYSWSNNYESSVYNKQGYIPCTVDAFKGLHAYSPISITLPSLDGSQTVVQTSVGLDEFYPLKGVDYYDQDWDLPF
jgi:hypothetical protein